MGIRRKEYTDQEWETLRATFDRRCVKCGRKETRKEVLQADHIVPFGLGGDSCISNIQPLCESCNKSKGNRSNLDYRLIFFGKFRFANEKIQNANYLRSRIRMLISLLGYIPDIYDLIYGWRLSGSQTELLEKEINEWMRW